MWGLPSAGVQACTAAGTLALQAAISSDAGTGLAAEADMAAPGACCPA